MPGITPGISFSLFWICHAFIFQRQKRERFETYLFLYKNSVNTSLFKVLISLRVRFHVQYHEHRMRAFQTVHFHYDVTFSLKSEVPDHSSEQSA